MKITTRRPFAAPLVRLTIHAVAAIAVLLAVGCTPAYPTCRRDTHCPRHLRCIDGLCGQCRSDADCPGDARCRDRICVKKPDRCRSDADCPRGRRCVDGACLVPTCAEPGDCPAGMACRDWACVPEAEEIRDAAPGGAATAPGG